MENKGVCYSCSLGGGREKDAVASQQLKQSCLQTEDKSTDKKRVLNT